MPRILIREGMIFLLMVAVSALIIHPDLLNAPMERLSLMSERGNYLHPLIYGGILYLAVGFFRLIASFIGKLFRAKSKS